MSRLDDILPKVGQSDSDVFEAHTLAVGDVWEYIECIHLTDLGKQQIKDLMLELFEDTYKVLPIQPNGRPMFIANGVLEEDYRKKVNEL